MIRVASALFLLSLLPACAESRAAGNDAARPTGPAARAAPGTAGTQPQPEAFRTHPTQRGVPHSGAIAQVALTRSGNAALTVDGFGGARLWRSLDGRSEPLVIPAVDVRHGAVARRGDNTLTCALLDATSTLQLFVSRADGSFHERPLASKLASNVADAALLPGGMRAVVLRTDGRIDVIDVDRGSRLTTTSRRRFRPDRLLLSDNGRAAVAVELRSGADNKSNIVLHRLGIDTDRGTVTIRGNTRIAQVLGATPRQFFVSPSGRQLGFFEGSQDKVTKGFIWNVRIVDMQTRNQRTVDLSLPINLVPSGGFETEHTLVVNTQPNGGEWTVDLRHNVPEMAARPGPATHLTGQPAHAYAGGTHVASAGDWLYVRAKGAGEPLYLGYEAFRPGATALSPGGGTVAWTTSFHAIYVENARNSAGQVTRIETDPREPATALAFVTEELLVTAHTASLVLRRPDTGDELDRADASGTVYGLAGDGKGHLLVGRNATQTWLYRITDGKVAKDPTNVGFASPIIIDDGAHQFGFTDDGVWTAGNDGKLRTYTFAELEAGLTRGQMRKRGQKLPASPFAIDSSGASYIHASQKILRKNFAGKVLATFPLPQGANRVVPSPNAKRVAISHSNSLISVFDTRTSELLWSFSTLAGQTGIAWSQDGSRLSAGGHLGTVVLDAATGEPIRRTCGFWFVARTTAPAAFFNNGVANLCTHSPQ